MQGKYFSKKDFDLHYSDYFEGDYDFIELGSADTYNENDIYGSIKNHDEKVLISISIQLAIIGLGNKTYGIVKCNGEEIDIKSYFDKTGIKYSSTLGTKLESGDLTPRRIMRFYRYIIYDYLTKNRNVKSYLYRKYCPILDEKLSFCIFPGFEHMVSPGITDDEVILLIKTYKNLDTRINKNITTRIHRALMAQGYSQEFLSRI
uniref:Uncharacterized protein n=1 Tax=Stereomyxa ramosa TaxID=1078864 RepID=A0A7S2ACU4_9EUKA|mmetsp:Transcript_680/g.852  ORF Transcript_680/g.852 Transcript_680/m.852 type:complete len:204 (+) Transcript_680:223-834(+)